MGWVTGRGGDGRWVEGARALGGPIRANNNEAPPPEAPIAPAFKASHWQRADPTAHLFDAKAGDEVLDWRGAFSKLDANLKTHLQIYHACLCEAGAVLEPERFWAEASCIALAAGAIKEPIPMHKAQELLDSMAATLSTKSVVLKPSPMLLCANEQMVGPRQLQDAAKKTFLSKYCTSNAVPPALVGKTKTRSLTMNLAIHLSRIAYSSAEYRALALRQIGFDASTLHDFEVKGAGVRGFVVADFEGNTHTVFEGSSWSTGLKNYTTSLDGFSMVSPAWLSDDARLHRGYVAAVDEVWPEISAARLAAAGSKDGEHFFHGHSMGGSLAEIAGVRAQQESGQPSTITVFGAPYVGNEAYSKFVRREDIELVRVATFNASGRDPVSFLPPPSLGYVSSGRQKNLQTANATSVGEQAESTAGSHKGLHRIGHYIGAIGAHIMGGPHALV